MRYPVRRGLRVALQVPLIALLFGAGCAGCAAPATVPAAGPVTVSSGVTYVPLLDNVPVMAQSTNVAEQDIPVLTTAPFMMQRGEVLRVTDQLEVRIPSGHGSQTDNELECFGQRPNPSPNPSPSPIRPPIQDVIGQISTGVNVGAGVNGSDSYQWNVSMLITPSAQDSPFGYYCQILTYAADKNTGYEMDVLAPAPGQTTYGTWLKVSSGSEVGAQMWSDGQGTCHPDGTGTCEYIGGSGRPAAIDVFSGDDWTAADAATTFDAVATFQITDCHNNTSSCPASDSGDGIFGMSGSEGDTWLDVDQLYPDGSVCQVNRGYSEESTGGQVQLSESYYDSDNQHHLPLYYDLSAPVSELCRGSRLFTVFLHVGWTDGNPVKLDGGNVSVIDSGYAKTTVVPDVTGRAQAQADDAIEANGLATWPPLDYVASTAPPGTVLDQNSPAGTIEPSGSPVELTVSLGQATVPDVIGDRPAVAVQAIKSVGLTAITLPPIISCSDPETEGTVQWQDPARSAQVPLGSQVDIRVVACTR
jgi:PASTA domain